MERLLSITPQVWLHSVLFLYNFVIYDYLVENDRHWVDTCCSCYRSGRGGGGKPIVTISHTNLLSYWRKRLFESVKTRFIWKGATRVATVHAVMRRDFGIRKSLIRKFYCEVQNLHCKKSP